MSEKINLLNYDREGMQILFESLGEKAFHARQVLKWIHQHKVTGFSEMTDLSKSLRKQLQEVAIVAAPQVVFEQASKDGTRKWIMQLDCNNRIETVLIPEENRATLCISSQVGCALDCSFCSTAQQGFNRNLSVAEIIGQVWVAAKTLGGTRPISNVVLMGMGEPLANLANVQIALNIMRDQLAYGLSKYRVTVSTAGLVPAMQRLAEHADVSLAVSLHAPDDALRDELVPINRKYPIKQLIQACQDFVRNDHKRKVTFEYVMLDGVNDSDRHARALLKLLAQVPAKINLIPFNPFPETRYQRSPQKRIDRFQKILSDGGMNTIMRRTRGGDIDAACGQLVGRVEDKSRRALRQITVNLQERVS
ncbi:MAG: 23S rRNA (adenine(2503)-C(2))-methyltransferase RlmN [gamma proteobacterium symbiont of Bathyaustriella thionipta]|nr:23S rRNA (adenine(2503)-C(2))-methyltransferase RlmN [gamma proteobacterium symbiont of Bathyaustriella thionipta]